jgi:hypothetical protein
MGPPPPIPLWPQGLWSIDVLFLQLTLVLRDRERLIEHS